MNPFSPTANTRVRRHPERASYDPATVYAIIDDAYCCQVAFNLGDDIHQIPTACWREGNYLYIHGSNGSRMVRALASGSRCCVGITHVDGLVLARSAFSSSMNYRSVLIYGQFEIVEDPDHKLEALHQFMEFLCAGRWQEARQPNSKELAATTVLRIPIEEVVAKTRSGPPKDDTEDYALPIWAGVLPLQAQAAPPIADPQLASDVPLPAYLRAHCAEAY